MTTVPPDDNSHVVDALPEYLAGALDQQMAQTMRDHLLTCAACDAELRAWQRIAAVEHTAAVNIPVPSLALLDAVWATVDAPVTATAATSTVQMAPTLMGAEQAQQPTTWQRILAWAAWGRGNLWHGGIVALRQIRLLQVSIWVASAVAMLLATLYALAQPAQSTATIGGILSFALPLIAATGAAFLYGPETDRGIEFALSTPTSSRTIMLSRFLLLLGYNVTLALLATLCLVLLRGADFWVLTQHWLGAMALLSSMSLMLSLLLNPLVALGSAFVLWLSRALHISDGISIQLTPDMFWQTSPQLLLLAAALLLLALLYVPRQGRLTE